MSRSHGGASGAPGPGRDVWVDVVKGLAIVAVVEYHAANFLDKFDLLPGAWDFFTEGLGEVRMPVFFFASGLFAAATLVKPWGRTVERRLTLYLYLYILWSVIRFVVYQMPPWTSLPDGGRIEVLLTIFFWPTGGLWFLYALILFFVLIRLARPVPVAAQIGAAAVVSAVVGSGLLSTGNSAWDKMLLNLVFFLAGCYLGPRVRRWAKGLGSVQTVLLVSAFILASAAVNVLDLIPVPFVRLALSCLAVAATIALALWLARIPPRWNVFSYLGERTLPIYLGHYLVAGGIVAAVATSTADLPSSVLYVLPIAVTATAVIVSLLLNRALRGMHGVLDAPRPLLRAVARRFEEPAAGGRTSAGSAPTTAGAEVVGDDVLTEPGEVRGEHSPAGSPGHRVDKA